MSGVQKHNVLCPGTSPPTQCLPFPVCGKPPPDRHLHANATQNKTLKLMSGLDTGIRGGRGAGLLQAGGKAEMPPVVFMDSGLSSVLKRKRRGKVSHSGDERISETSANNFFKLGKGVESKLPSCFINT